MPRLTGGVGGGKPNIVFIQASGIHVGAMLDEQLHHRGMSGAGGRMQRRGPVATQRQDVSAVFDQNHGNRIAALECSYL